MSKSVRGKSYRRHVLEHTYVIALVLVFVWIFHALGAGGHSCG